MDDQVDMKVKSACRASVDGNRPEDALSASRGVRMRHDRGGDATRSDASATNAGAQPGSICRVPAG
ncbi:hypothetical protein ACFSHT_37245 [Paraburkholderia silviterrae]|uniref:Uncharacterized protein n=1 Tax=Paraburkholderia silviterrae TaxID=2528715 RepID=A0A4R5M7D1_9BURK|nr:hypothetical protein [Paraburkholderia silviterrae]TDG21683.1 hypothetical protein EYW47_20090 [Paraburkholderia silviterrae]